MATVRNAITMEDRMTPVFNKMIKAMTTTVKVMEQVNKSANSGVTSDVFDQVERDINQANNALLRFKANIDRTDDEMSELNTTTNQTRTAFSNFANIGMGAFALGQITSVLSQVGQVVNQATLYLDTMSQTSARLDLINDGMQTQAELQQKIFEASMRARMSYQDMAQSVAKLNMLASESFSSNDEAIAFVETLNKMFVVSGTGAQEASAAMYQLTQAMGAGKLQGDEFRSIMENAPMLAEAISKSMGVSKGELKELSSQGVITADIIKQAMVEATGTVEEQFNSMPKTWAQNMEQLKNIFMMKMQQISEKFSNLMNSESFSNFINIVMIGANSITLAFDAAIVGITFFMDALNALMPVLQIVGLLLFSFGLLLIPSIIKWLGIQTVAVFLAAKAWLAKTAALFLASKAWQAVAVSAGVANWVLLLIVVVIALLIAYVMSLGVTFSDIIGFIVGLFYALLAVVGNVAIFFINSFSYLGNFIKNVFTDPIGAVKMGFAEMAEHVLSNIRWLIGGIEDLINLIPGVEVTMTTGIDNMLNEIGAWKKQIESEHGVTATNKMEYLDLGDSYSNGFQTGSDFLSGLGDFGSSFTNAFDTPTSSLGLSNNNVLDGGHIDTVGSINDDVSMEEEDIKLLKDIATTKFINQFTTLQPNVQVTFGDVHETADVNGVMRVIEDMVEQSLAHQLTEEVL